MYRRGNVELTPWKYAIPVSVLLTSSIVWMYVLFSKIGVAYPDGIVSNWFWPITLLLVITTVILWRYALKAWNTRYAEYLEEYKRAQ